MLIQFFEKSKHQGYGVLFMVGCIFQKIVTESFRFLNQGLLPSMSVFLIDFDFLGIANFWQRQIQNRGF